MTSTERRFTRTAKHSDSRTFPSCVSVSLTLAFDRLTNHRAEHNNDKEQSAL